MMEDGATSVVPMSECVSAIRALKINSSKAKYAKDKAGLPQYLTE